MAFLVLGLEYNSQFEKKRIQNGVKNLLIRFMKTARRIRDRTAVRAFDGIIEQFINPRFKFFGDVMFEPFGFIVNGVERIA